ncbi:unnamed protein product [Rotaria socialis]|uniref:Uncharacterized protein n=1 Tax=Rotaria socialis TaxID=392032 RepID=A0A821V1L3_9BILA|nr:unnamed protein product [Rotaria socialis]CAF4899350.1 unnamed protein product [Rotaria socialis]
MEGKNFLLPDFYAKSLPPQIGFLGIAIMMCILGEELTSLRTELQLSQEVREKQTKAIEYVNTVKNDISDIKTLIGQIKNEKNENNSVKEDIASANPPTETPPGTADGDEDSSSITNDVNDNLARPSYRDRLLSNPGPSNNSNHYKQQRERHINQHRQGNASQQQNQSQRNEHGRRQTTLIGSRVPTNDANEFSGVRVKFEIYVGRCALTSNRENLLQYCKDRCRFSEIECEELKTRSDYYKSFKVTVNELDKGKIFYPEFGPENMYVRKFYTSNGNRNIDSNTDSNNLSTD